MSKFSNAQEYLASIDPIQAETLQALIAYIRSLNSDLDVVIAWNVPQIKLGKQYVFGMSAAKNHITLAPWGTGILDNLRPSMGDYVVNKSTFQVPSDWTIDKALIGVLVSQRLAELGA